MVLLSTFFKGCFLLGTISKHRCEDAKGLDIPKGVCQIIGLQTAAGQESSYFRLENINTMLVYRLEPWREQALSQFSQT